MRILNSFLALFLIVAACGPGVDIEVNSPSGPATARLVPEDYLSPFTQVDNIDSPAFWHGPAGQHWVITTAKAADVLVIYDAESGAEIKRAGAPGSGPGQLARPNGVMVLGDMALIVERDNHRVQGFSLPDFNSLGLVGYSELRRPYGLYAYPVGENQWRLYVTDDYETEAGENPPDEMCGERVKLFEIGLADGKLGGRLLKSFGQTSGGGVLNVVESVWGDPEHGVLLVADERDNVMEVYDLEGNYSGKTIGQGLFKFQTEGIVLIDCGGGEGWWLASDQGPKRTVFHVFERKGFGYAGSFAGQVVANTDGIAVTQQPFGKFRGGMFMAVHDDGGIGAFSLATLSDSLGIKLDCIK